MGRTTLCVAFLLTGAILALAQEFKRMPDFRGSSFGLENFLLQPFNLASQSEEHPQQPLKRREHSRQPTPSPYNVEFQVQNDDYDMRKVVSTLPRAPLLVSHDHDVKPVHEFPEGPPPTPPRRRQSTGDAINGFENPNKRRIPTPEIRRPLERPSEFQLTITENEPFLPLLEEPRPDRQRKRVMKRRRKKPSSPMPPLSEDGPKGEDSFKETEVTMFGADEADTPTSYQHSKDTSAQPEIVSEQRHQRRKPPGYNKRQREPALNIQTPTEEEAVEAILRYEDGLISEASQRVPQREIPEDIKPAGIFPTTEQPQEPTHKLKTLLKQQNGQLSLSELLQTQNLSLSDFLKGNPGALSALGANKLNGEKGTTPQPEPETEKPKTNYSRPHVPKISPKSRPFSKPANNTKTARRTTTTTTEESVPELPKKLQIIEVTTSDKPPTYNGFAPKHPRTRGQKPEGRPSFTREKADEQASESTKPVTKEHEPTEKMAPEESEKDEESLDVLKTTSRSPVHRLTTLAHLRDSTIAERVVPKRFNEYRSKQRIDRRKPTDGTTEGTTVTETQDTTFKVSATTEQIKAIKEQKNRVRIPFMSVNNPEISVILPSRKVNATTEKPRERTSPVIRDRINLFKRINSEEKQLTENAVDAKESEPTEPSVATTSISTSTEPITSKVRVNAESTTEEEEMDGTESSDEIVELLKSGSNAQRLHRILAARNMTVTELLEKRANSSKQPNVTHLFEKQTDSQLSGKRKVTELNDNFHPSTEKTSQVLTTKRPMPAFSEFPNFKIEKGEKVKVKPEMGKPHETNSFDELFVDESVIRPIKLPFDKDEMREPKAYEKTPIKETTHKPRHHLNLSPGPGTEGKAKHPVPLWNVDEKSIYSSNPYGYPTYDLNNNLAATRSSTEAPKQQEIEEETILLETVSRNLDSNNRLKSNINDILKEQVEQVEVVKEVKEDRTFIPPAVKSAIIASGVVMGIALLVFVAIFAACGWKQRQFRLRARSSILNDSLNGSARKTIRRTGTLSPVSFKRSSLYKKSIDFEDTESSISGSSNTSSYLWNTLKHTFQSRNSTLKNRQEKEEKIQERENRSRRNTLSREDAGRRNTMSREDPRRESTVRDVDLPRRNTLTRDDLRRDSVMSRDTLSRDLTRDSVISRDTLNRDLVREDSRRSSCFREENRRLNSLLRENERCSFKKIDPDRNIIQTSVNFKRGSFNGSSRHFDSCDHFN